VHNAYKSVTFIEVCVQVASQAVLKSSGSALLAAATRPKDDADGHMIYKAGDLVFNFNRERKCKQRTTVFTTNFL
jgi:hypothetical protein